MLNDLNLPANPPPENAPDQVWLDLLPKPPQPLYAANEDRIHMWLIDVAEAGGSAGLMWAYRPENWPFDVIWRSRCQHIYSRLLEQIDEQHKRKRTQQARQQIAHSENAAHEARRKAGWA